MAPELDDGTVVDDIFTNATRKKTLSEQPTPGELAGSNKEDSVTDVVDPSEDPHHTTPGDPDEPDDPFHLDREYLRHHVPADAYERLTKNVWGSKPTK